MRLGVCRRSCICRLVGFVSVTFICVQIYYVYTINLQNDDDLMNSPLAGRKIRQLVLKSAGGVGALPAIISNVMVIFSK